MKLIFMNESADWWGIPLVVSQQAENN